MTQDEIIEMAREAGFYNHTPMYFDDEMLVAFAHLIVAKATEETNAKANASWTLMCKKMVDIEREACAKIVEDSPSYDWHKFACEAAYAIRSRGEQALAQPEQDGECKYCTHGCAACDARKLQKEAHDLL